MPEKKTKLRTASEVISRLKWAYDQDHSAQNSIVGYDCRINGPMEKCVADFAGINEGGDIPEHRILYFRKKGNKEYDKLIFWDRVGRVDQLFGSGNPGEAVSPITVGNAIQAVGTMKRLAEEKAIRAQEKAKRRARQQSRKALKTIDVTSSPDATAKTKVQFVERSSTVDRRHVWEKLHHAFEYDSETSDWFKRSIGWNLSPKQAVANRIKFITWNVLFDLHRNNSHALVEGDDSLLGEEDTTVLRWKELLSILENEDADIISLQEVTPRFLRRLQSSHWVQNEYVLSSCCNDLRGLECYGNLFLWKYSSFQSCDGMYLCRDRNRNRAIVLSLTDGNGLTFNIANVHLPADQNDSATGDLRDRTQARQRELAAVIGKLQALEQSQRCNGRSCIPVILGDFNSGTEGPNFFSAEYLVDAWLHPLNDARDQPGYTFDWKRNLRANKTRIHGHQEREPRRIDRLFVGNHPKVVPIHSYLLGDLTQGFPPSDHFGVSTLLDIRESAIKNRPILYDPQKVEHNVWASSAVPTADSLLALLFESQELNGSTTKLFDPSSTLPQAHMTLIHGFVDLSNDQAQKLAIQAVRDAVHDSLYSEDPSMQWTLPVNQSSLTVFEHRESATLVCTPSIEEGSWLKKLYRTLRVKFALCDEQESRFVGGWTPHMSLEKHSSTTDARSALDHLITSGSWKDSELSAFGVGLFRRDPVDQKFYTVASVPLVERAGVPLPQTHAFLADSGRAWYGSSTGASHVVLYELQRASSKVVNTLWGGRVHSRLELYGSQALASSISGISDVDVVLRLESGSTSNYAEITNSSGSQILQLLADQILETHASSRVRMRITSRSGSPALYVLTVKLAPNLPSADILLARTDAQGQPFDLASRHALDSLDEAGAILESAKRSSAMDVDIFGGAVRIVKLWAHRRKIYGTSTGFLGGGAWAVLMAWLLENSTGFEASSNKTETAAQELAVYFFRNVLKHWSNTSSIALDSSPVDTTAVVEERRKNMVILPPKSGGNYGRSSTKSTTLRTWQELRRAARLLLADFKAIEITRKLEVCLIPYALESRDVLALQVEVPASGVKPAEVKARGATLGLSLTVALERVVGADQIHPVSEMIRNKGSFYYFVGVDRAGENDRATGPLLRDFVSKHNALLEEESSHGGVNSRLLRLTMKEYQSRFSTTFVEL